MRQTLVSVEAWPVNVPLDAPYQFATGVYAGMSRTVVRVTTDGGLVGLGESPDAQDAARLRAIAPDLVGQDAGALCERLSSAPYAGPDRRDDPKVIVRNPLAAVEMALWDIAARSAGVPLCVLLGGPVRHEIAVTEYFAYRLPGPSARGEQTASQVAGYCARMVREHGSPAFEGKMGVRPLAEELLMLREVRNAIGPARMLRVDANMAWCPKTARQALIALDEIGVESVEEPVAGFEAMRQLRRRSNIPLSAHSSDILEAAKVGGPFALVLGITGCGGIGPTLRFAEDCKQAGVGFRFYSGDLGIATAATLNVAAAIPSVTGPHQTLLRWYQDDVISGGPFRPERGSVAVPASSGIGVDLDQAALERGIERFAKDGAYDYYAGPPVPRY